MGDRVFASAFYFYALMALAIPTIALAHEGPPFPIMMDEPAGDVVVSVWADPDIGEATFFIIVETPEGKMPAQAPEVSMWTEPVSGRLERVNYETRRESLRNTMQFTATPYFDQRDFWTVGFRIKSAQGDSKELATQVESTPPGFGPWDLAVYLFPFVLMGGLWVTAMVRRRRIVLAHQAASQEVAQENEPVETKVESRE